MLKILFLGMAVIFVEMYLRPDDWSLYIGKYRNLKQIFIYAFSALTIVLIDELYLASKVKIRPFEK